MTLGDIAEMLLEASQAAPDGGPWESLAYALLRYVREVAPTSLTDPERLALAHLTMASLEQYEAAVARHAAGG